MADQQSNQQRESWRPSRAINRGSYERVGGRESWRAGGVINRGSHGDPASRAINRARSYERVGGRESWRAGGVITNKRESWLTIFRRSRTFVLVPMALSTSTSSAQLMLPLLLRSMVLKP